MTQARAKTLTFDIALIIVVALALRPGIISIGPAMEEIQQHFSLPYRQGSLLTTIPDFLMGALALPAPWLARKLGRDRVILAALLLLAVSISLRAMAPNVSTLMLTTFGVGAGIAIPGTLLSGVIKEKFGAQAAQVMGVYSTALAAGSAISAFVTAPVTAASSWRWGIGMWGILAFIAVFSWVVLTKRHSDAGVPQGEHVGLPWGNSKAWRVALYFAAVNLIFYVMVTWTSSVYVDKGASLEQAGTLVGFYSIAFTVFSAVVTRLSRNPDRRVWLAASGIVGIVGALMMAYLPYGWAYVAVGLMALSVGIGFPLGMMLPIDNSKTVAETNAWTAFTLTIGYLITSTGPFISGWLRDATGGFTASLWFVAGVAAVSVVLSPFLAPRFHTLDRDVEEN